MAYPGGAEDQSAWAGVPGGLMRGLREAGAEAVSLDSSPGQAAETALKLALAPAYPPDRWRHPGRSLLLAALGPEVARLRGRTLARRIGEAGPLDAVLILGALATPPTDVPLVPYVDMTPRLSRDLGYPLWRGLPERALRARLRQQAALYHRAAAACPVTRFAADAIENDFRVSPESVHVVGIGRNHEPEAPERDWSRPRFLFVGSEWKRKRGAAVVESFRHVRERHPEATLDLVSEHPPDVGGEGVRAHGSIRGARVTQLFSHATCFVMPSRAEPVGIVYVEAGAAGTPSIGSAVGGAAELIGPGGTVVDPANQDALTTAMLELSEPDTARRLGALALEHSRWFTWRATAGRILEALQLKARTPTGEAS